MLQLYKNIKSRRLELNMSQSELAKKVGYSDKGMISKVERGIVDLSQSKILEFATALECTPAYLMGWDAPATTPDNSIPFAEPYVAPILGSIPAGYPATALQDIEGYASIPYCDSENYFFLRVHGDSMINAGINDGDLVLLRHQSCADNGQIVAARVNGDEATLKRFKKQGDTVLLLAENPAYDPKIVPASSFAVGDAQIIGVALEVRHSL